MCMLSAGRARGGVVVVLVSPCDEVDAAEIADMVVDEVQVAVDRAVMMPSPSLRNETADHHPGVGCCP